MSGQLCKTGNITISIIIIMVELTTNFDTKYLASLDIRLNAAIEYDRIE